MFYLSKVVFGVLFYVILCLLGGVFWCPSFMQDFDTWIRDNRDDFVSWLLE